jgi:peroxiredoxin|tara:strand:+ start:7215 stop:7535 length:321 start_codon:yes stop_codon:yes gene_type:complete
LAAVQDQIKLLTRLGIKVVAVTTDSEALVRKTVSDEGYTFPVGFGVTEADIASVGAVPGERKDLAIIEPAEFIIRPGGEVAASLYATTQLGRMNPREIAVFVKDRS